MTKIKIGYVVLGGVKLWIQIRSTGKNHWVSTRKSVDGPHLPDVEKRLKKIRHAKQSLSDQKVVAI